jgi:redox-sensitive bicupin YhaK (pirin superfamily)
LFDASERATLALAPGRRAYVHVARGAVTVNGAALETGDALKVTDSATLTVEQGRGAEVLVFDLPGESG